MRTETKGLIRNQHLRFACNLMLAQPKGITSLNLSHSYRNCVPSAKVSLARRGRK